MLTIAIQEVYDGKVFIPEQPCEITRGSKATLTVETIYNSIIIPFIAYYEVNHGLLLHFRNLSR
jgi:hypothetical protein